MMSVSNVPRASIKSGQDAAPTLRKPLQAKFRISAPACSQRFSRASFKVLAGADFQRDIMGDFGARDPTAGELESNFADKTIGNFDTEHILRMPQEVGKKLYNLVEKDCTPERGASVADMTDCLVWQKAVWNWKIVEVDGTNRIRCETTVKDFAAGLELFSRVGEVAEAQGHHPDLHLTKWNKLSMELWSHSAGGLTENDFIMAAKIDAIEKADLLPKPKPKKQRFWA